MGDGLPVRGRGFVGPDVESPVDLHRVAIDDLPPELQGQFEAVRLFPTPVGPRMTRIVRLSERNVPHQPEPEEGREEENPEKLFAVQCRFSDLLQPADENGLMAVSKSALDGQHFGGQDFVETGGGMLFRALVAQGAHGPFEQGPEFDAAVRLDFAALEGRVEFSLGVRPRISR